MKTVRCPHCEGSGKRIDGAWLRALRTRLGVSQLAAAEAAGYANSATLCDIESGKRNLPANRVKRLLAFYGTLSPHQSASGKSPKRCR